MTYSEQDTFDTALPFNIRPRELTFATAAALTVFFVALFGVDLGSAGSGAVTAAPIKTDRLTIGNEQACAGQAWGNWNDACLQALAVKQNLQIAPSRTVEFRDVGRQMSVLERQPAKS